MFDAITEWMDWASSQLMNALSSAVPAVPESVTTACTEIEGYMGNAGLYSELVPWGHLGSAVLILTLGITTAIVLRTARIGVSVVSGGGGA